MTAVRCRQCDRELPRFSASMVRYPIAHVNPAGEPCRPSIKWSRLRMGECHAWQAVNLAEVACAR